MKNLRMLCAIALVIVTEAAFAKGFSNGNHLETQKLSGTAVVQCLDGDGYDVRFVSCTSNQLSPSEFDNFVYDKYVDADHVQIFNESMKGKKNNQKRIYHAKNMKSREFNLWVSTLTQNPLLKTGENHLKVVFLNRKKVVAEDYFHVTVSKGQDLQCESTGINYGNLSCPSDLAVCRDYFRSTNCRP